tara:strand:+ start:131 stop:391 length:261 start_codon:yes stop_codon:yes gene_type:complete
VQWTRHNIQAEISQLADAPIMRMLASQEAMFHNGKGRGAARLSQTGRFKKVKMEADHAEGSATYELDPFAALSSFISAANVQAGGG